MSKPALSPLSRTTLDKVIQIEFVEAPPRGLVVILRAIGIVDEIDRDANLEDGGDGEPSLTSPAGGDSQIIWCAGSDDDREDCSFRLPPATLG